MNEPKNQDLVASLIDESEIEELRFHGMDGPIGEGSTLQQDILNRYVAVRQAYEHTAQDAARYRQLKVLLKICEFSVVSGLGMSIDEDRLDRVLDARLAR